LTSPGCGEILVYTDVGRAVDTDGGEAARVPDEQSTHAAGPAPAAGPQAGSWSLANVVLLQRTAGNAAVAGLLGGGGAPPDPPGQRSSAGARRAAAGPVIQRDLAAVPGMLGSGRAGTTYTALRERLAKYFEDRGVEERYAHIVEMERLISTWKKAHEKDKSKRGKKHRDRLELLERAIVVERQRAMSHADYVRRMREGWFKYLSGEAKPEYPAVHALVGGQTKATSTEAGLDDKALAMLRKHGLTEAEVLAIKVYTVGDYALINPTVEGGKAGANRLIESLPWVGGMIDVNLRPGDAPGPNASAAEQAAYKKKEATWKAEVAKLLARARADWHRLELEEREHADVLTEALYKLPVDQSGQTTYRGMRMTLDEYESWKTERTEIIYPSFFSVSRHLAKGQFYASKKREDNKLGVLLTCHLKTARSVEELSVHRSEGELLVLPRAKLHIDRVRPVFGQKWDREIEVTER
jgi:hypothetical protein